MNRVMLSMNYLGSMTVFGQYREHWWMRCSVLMVACHSLRGWTAQRKRLLLVGQTDFRTGSLHGWSNTDDSRTDAVTYEEFAECSERLPTWFWNASGLIKEGLVSLFCFMCWARNKFKMRYPSIWVPFVENFCIFVVSYGAICGTMHVEKVFSHCPYKEIW